MILLFGTAFPLARGTAGDLESQFPACGDDALLSHQVNKGCNRRFFTVSSKFIGEEYMLKSNLNREWVGNGASPPYLPFISFSLSLFPPPSSLPPSSDLCSCSFFCSFSMLPIPIRSSSLRATFCGPYAIPQAVYLIHSPATLY